MVNTGVAEMDSKEDKVKTIDELMKDAKRAIAVGAIRGFARYTSDKGYAHIDSVFGGRYPQEYVDFVDDNIPLMIEAAEDADMCLISPNPVDKYVSAMYERGIEWLDEVYSAELLSTREEIENLNESLKEANKRMRDLVTLHDRVWGCMHIAAKDIRSAAEEFMDMDVEYVDDWIDATKHLLDENGFMRDGTPKDDGTYSMDMDAIVGKRKEVMKK